MARLDIVEAAREWLGVPWKLRGRTRRGADCIGLLAHAVTSCGYRFIDDLNYSDEPFHGELERGINKQRYMEKCAISDIQAGDIFLMAFGDMPTSHVAIYTGNSLIHSYRRVGKVVEHSYHNGRPAWLREVYRCKH